MKVQRNVLIEKDAALSGIAKVIFSNDSEFVGNEFEELNAITASIEFELPEYTIQVRKIDDKCHLGNPEKMPIDIFRKLLSVLKSRFYSELTTTIYPGQPVYEFSATQEQVKEVLNKNFINIKVEI